MTKTDKRIIRYIEKNGALPVGADKFTPISVRGAFKRGIIKLNTARNAYLLTRYGLTLCEKSKEPELQTCKTCFFVHLRFIPKCTACENVTPYGLQIEKKKAKRHEYSASRRREDSRLS